MCQEEEEEEEELICNTAEKQKVGDKGITSLSLMKQTNKSF